jgi:Leucine-rich repeat (LRR) protein
MLQLQSNRLAGHIPEDISRLPQLEELRLDWNKLTGPIPATVSVLTQLRRLSLAGNQLTGKMTRWFVAGGTHTHGIDKLVCYLRCTGPIPAGLSLLTELKELVLTNNRLTGALVAVT